MAFENIKKCRACPLHKYRRNIVIGRGTIPAEILFMGEAPGESEDILGEAFVGRSGRLLDKMLWDALLDIYNGTNDYRIDYFIVNTILCRPTDCKGGTNRQPKKEEVCKCAENIMTIYKAVKPKIVIFIGKVAEKYYKDEFPYTESIQHPAYLLRGGGEAHPNYRMNVRKLSEIFRRFTG